MIGGVRVRHIDELAQFVQSRGISIGVIATPGPGAQTRPKRLVAAGITSLLNFAPGLIYVPPGISVRKVDLAVELQILSYYEQRRASATVAAGLRAVPGEPRQRRPPRLGSACRFWSSESTIAAVRCPCSSVSPRARTPGQSGGWSRSADNVREAVMLSTCNRTEVYAVAELFHGAYGDVRDLLCELGDLTVDELTPHLYSQHDTRQSPISSRLPRASIRPCSVRPRSWARFERRGRRRSPRCGTLDAEPALPLGTRHRKACPQRDRYRPGHGIDQPCCRRDDHRVTGEMNGMRVLVIGAGSMGEGVAVALHRAGGADILVANRSDDRAASLAERVNGVSVGFDRLREAIAASDVIVAGTGADQASSPSLVDEARRTTTRPLHIVDIGVPRNVDPDVAELAGVTLLDPRRSPRLGRPWVSHRAGEAEHVRSIVGEEVENYLVDSTARQAAPLVA